MLHLPLIEMPKKYLSLIILNRGNQIFSAFWQMAARSNDTEIIRGQSHTRLVGQNKSFLPGVFTGFVVGAVGLAEPEQGKCYTLMESRKKVFITTILN